jgi:hypothetical protein
MDGTIALIVGLLDGAGMGAMAGTRLQLKEVN